MGEGELYILISGADVTYICLLFMIVDERWNGTNMAKTWFSDKTETKHHIVKKQKCVKNALSNNSNLNVSVHSDVTLELLGL